MGVCEFVGKTEQLSRRTRARSRKNTARSSPGRRGAITRKEKENARTSLAPEKKRVIRRTVYVSDIDHQDCAGYSLRVLPSKTAIARVKPHIFARTEDEGRCVQRTVYCTNIDKKVSQARMSSLFLKQFVRELKAAMLTLSWKAVKYPVRPPLSSPFKCTGSTIASADDLL
nr:polyadenylate-binding protein-interacting protein 12-like [Ipomoea batatas]